MSDSSIQGSENDHRLISERLPVLKEALELLYIRNNISGRLKFLQEWPAPAQYIFDPELVQYDHDGTRDRERRAQLEAEADERRVALLGVVEELEEKSVERGVMQMEYIQSVINHFGRELSLFLYTPRVVDRFIPPPPEVEKPAEPPKAEAPPPPPAPEEEFHIPEFVIAPGGTGNIPIENPPAEREKPPASPAPVPPAAPPATPEPEKPAVHEHSDDPLDSIKPIEPFSPSVFEQVPPDESETGTEAPRPTLKIFGIRDPGDPEDNSGGAGGAG